MKRWVMLAAGVALCASAGGQPAPDAGGDLYREECASCHGQNLNDGEFGPALKSAAFTKRWAAADARALQAFVTATMPPGGAGSLPPEDYAAITAYLRAANGFPAARR